MVIELLRLKLTPPLNTADNLTIEGYRSFGISLMLIVHTERQSVKLLLYFTW